MRRTGVDIELRRIGGIVAFKAQRLGAHADIQTIILLEVIRRAVHGDFALAADVDDAHLAPLKERIGSQLLTADQLNALIDRHDTAGDDAVKVGIRQNCVVRYEHGFNQVFAAQTLCRIVLCIRRRGRLTNG